MDVVIECVDLAIGRAVRATCAESESDRGPIGCAIVRVC
jgi:hypothetical protein